MQLVHCKLMLLTVSLSSTIKRVSISDIWPRFTILSLQLTYEVLNYWLIVIYLSYWKNNHSQHYQHRMLLEIPKCLRLDYLYSVMPNTMLTFSVLQKVTKPWSVCSQLPADVSFCLTSGRPAQQVMAKEGLALNTFQVIVHIRGTVYGNLGPCDIAEIVKYLTWNPNHFIFENYVHTVERLRGLY